MICKRIVAAFVFLGILQPTICAYTDFSNGSTISGANGTEPSDNVLPKRERTHSERFNKAVQQGSDLLQQLNSSTEQASPFTDYSALERWGWDVTPKLNGGRIATPPISILPGLHSALAGLGLSAASPPNFERVAVQSKSFSKEGALNNPQVLILVQIAL